MIISLLHVHIKVIGKMTKNMDLEILAIKMVINILDNGYAIKDKAMEHYG